MSYPRAPRARPLHALLLACALLFAVQLGLWHGIAHASPSAKALHSCAAFDAATLAERLPAALLDILPCRQRPPRIAAIHPPAQARPAAFHFLARAPPPAATPHPGACRHLEYVP